MATHTPGPWTIIPAIEYDGDDDEFKGGIIDPASIEGANGDPVCSFGSLLGSGTLYENEADYHLIAAAPMLLEGAQDTVVALRLLRIGAAMGDTAIDAKALEVIDAHIDELSFAIAAATGAKP